MKIKLSSVLVNNQEKALRFYTEILGFAKKRDIPLGEHKWLTVVSPEETDGTELLLEPMGFEPSKAYQKALYEAGIPLTMFDVSDIASEHARLSKLGVKFSMPPRDMGIYIMAVLDDTCGNNIQLVQMK